MRLMRILVVAVMCAGAISATRAADANVDDIITLAQKNLGDDVQIAAVEASTGSFNLKANDIVRLKEAKISDAVIAAMIRHNKGGGAPAPVAAAPAPAANNPAPVAPAPVQAANPPVVGAAAFGVLNIENLDEKTWSYRFEPDTQTIWISTSANDGRGNIPAHGGVSIKLPAAAYNVRYNGQDRGQKVAVFENDKSLLMLSRVETVEVEALYVSVFERGERKASGRLVTLRDVSAPREDNVIRKSSEAPQQRPAVQQPVVVVEQQPTVIYRDAPTYIYTQPSVIYSSGYYGGGYYGGGYPRVYGGSYYGRGSYGYGSYYGGHRSGVSVGVGFRY